MGSNRRFRGMKHPSSKHYSQLPVMERDLDTKDERVGQQGLFSVIAVLLLCACVLVGGVILFMQYSLAPPTSDTSVSSSTEGYRSTSFVAEASEAATELLTQQKPYVYSSAGFHSHQAQTLTGEELNLLVKRTDNDYLFTTELRPLLNVRVAGTPGNERAREHILSQLNSHNIWTIEEDRFSERTPHGDKEFVNVVATVRPEIKRRLVFACHYDSKFYAPRTDGKVFIGATDSAVPCAMMLDLGRNLADLLASTTQLSTSLQFLFLDGEEAFKRWTATDSLYGSRHLAQKMLETPHPLPTSKTNQLDAMDMFVLLDLIGTPDPVFKNYFPATSIWFRHLVNIETRLKTLQLISNRASSYFDARSTYSGIEDDHRPFVTRGVNRVLHLISSPFPSVWHSMEDNEEALDPVMIDDLTKILHVFVAEYLHLLDSQPAEAA